MAYNLASFKNSRNYPRPATTSAVTSDLTVGGNGGAPTLIVPLNPNLTYVTVYNLDPANTLNYYYQAAGAPPPTTAQILAEGFPLIAGAAVGLESPQAVWAVSQVPATIKIALDEGSG